MILFYFLFAQVSDILFPPLNQFMIQKVRKKLNNLQKSICPTDSFTHQALIPPCIY